VLRDGPVEAGGRPVPIETLRGPVDPEWRLYARSASDDKAPIAGWLAALDALRAAKVPLAVNLKLFLEGEEEAGSPHLAEVLSRHRDLLAADLMLLCDGPVHQSRRMQLYFGARGVVDVEITVYGPLRALHSGHYGNWAPNPAVLLAHLVAGLRDADGRIAVPGFYDDVRPPTPAEKAALARVPDEDAALREALALGATEAGNARLAERLLLPALNLRGLQAGGVGERAANAIPTQATASIDFRLVRDQTPERVRERVEAHVRAQGFHVVAGEPDAAVRRAHPRVARMVWGTGYPAARTALDSPIAQRLVRAVERAAGPGVILAPTLGGSIPMHLFADTLRVPIVGVPIANHDNNQHAANENIRIRNLWDGIEAYAAILAGFGRE
jgi:acetylornithine deacetylase/succinyl-diaminopimelate desuccinylase-like protein